MPRGRRGAAWCAAGLLIYAAICPTPCASVLPRADCWQTASAWHDAPNERQHDETTETHEHLRILLVEDDEFTSGVIAEFCQQVHSSRRITTVSCSHACAPCRSVDTTCWLLKPASRPWIG